MDEIEQWVNQANETMQRQQVENLELRKAMTTMFRKEEDTNLIKYQLDIGEELERCEHLLRGHVPKLDKNGNIYYEEAKEEFKVFNEFGVQQILHILAWYLNKNIILSNFDDDEVRIRVKQFAVELSNFIFINYEKIGLDNDEKIKHYPMIVMNLVNTVEAAYHRALFGGERTSLRTARTVTQSETPMNMVGSPSLHNQSKFSKLNPINWIKR